MADETPQPKPLEISAEALTEVESALRRYAKLVLDAKYSQWAEAEYIDRADMFVRWLKGEFRPGSRATGARITSGRKRSEEPPEEEKSRMGKKKKAKS